MERKKLLDCVLACCSPRRVILYGEKFVVDSGDLKSADLCIILEDCDKKSLLNRLYIKANMPFPVQFLLYSTEEWKSLLEDSGSYASAIEKKGTVLYVEKAQR